MNLYVAAAFAATYNICDFGAVPGASVLATASIQKAIDKCYQDGGGTVVVPAGEYLVGTINLKSNVEFHFEKGSCLKATTDLSAYQKNNENLAGVFYTENSDNVSITGDGEVYGQGMLFMECNVAKKIQGDVLNYIRQKSDFRKIAPGEIADGPVNPKDRFHQMIIFSNCTNVKCEDFKCKDAPYWTFLIVHCDRVWVNKVQIDNNLLIPNSDGCDVVSSSNVNISDCIFSCGDDAIVLAGYAHHYGDPGFKDIMRPSRNINVTNCTLRSRSSGIRIGGWDQNEMSNYNFSNVVIYDSNCGINLTVRDKGSIKNVNFSNIRIETRLHTGDWWGNGEPIKISAMRGVPDNPVGIVSDISFNNITCEGENSILLYASSESQIRNVRFSNFNFRLKQGPLEDIAGGNFDLRPNIVKGKEIFASDIPIVYLENVEGISFTQGTMEWGDMTKPYFTSAIEAKKVNGMSLNSVNAAAAPNSKYPVFQLENCKNVINNCK